MCCDGRDNDCDGLTDEDLVRHSYDGAPGTEGVGVCHASVESCFQGRWWELEEEVLPSEERCNGLDDDCDGEVDEDDGGGPLERHCYDGEVGTEDVGECHGGTQECANREWSECEGQVVPAEEACDGLDNDCDGAADEDDQGEPLARACYDGPPETRGVGACVEGTLTCEQGGWTEVCVGQRQPSPEVCNGRDDDCDGAVDEDDQGEPLERRCYAGPVGTEDVGECHGGTQTCEQGAWAAACEGQVVPAPEACNLRDDDCDGDVDEGEGEEGGPLHGACYDGAGNTRDIGVCRSGTHVCVDGDWSECEGQVLPAAEDHCDGRDNDCDGDTDHRQCTGVDCEHPIGLPLREGETVSIAGSIPNANGDNANGTCTTDNPLDDVTYRDLVYRMHVPVESSLLAWGNATGRHLELHLRPVAGGGGDACGGEEVACVEEVGLNQPGVLWAPVVAAGDYLLFADAREDRLGADVAFFGGVQLRTVRPEDRPANESCTSLRAPGPPGDERIGLDELVPELQLVAGGPARTGGTSLAEPDHVGAGNVRGHPEGPDVVHWLLAGSVTDVNGELEERSARVTLTLTPESDWRTEVIEDFYRAEPEAGVDADGLIFRNTQNMRLYWGYLGWPQDWCELRGDCPDPAAWTDCDRYHGRCNHVCGSPEGQDIVARDRVFEPGLYAVFVDSVDLYGADYTLTFEEVLQPPGVAPIPGSPHAGASSFKSPSNDENRDGRSDRIPGEGRKGAPGK